MTNHFKQFTETSYSGRKLLENHSLQQYGFWKILGEDPNCDMSGPHVQPDLGVVEGKLEDVIKYAVELPNFWQWGGGGDIILIPQPKKIDENSYKRQQELMRRKKELEEELKQINSELA